MLQNNDWIPASELVARELNSLRGKICSAIEAMSLPEKQERGIIANIKQFTYSSQDVLQQIFLLLVEEKEKQFKYSEQKVEMKNDLTSL